MATICTKFTMMLTLANSCLESTLTLSWRRPLWTGFYMITTSVMKELMTHCIFSTVSYSYCWAFLVNSLILSWRRSLSCRNHGFYMIGNSIMKELKTLTIFTKTLRGCLIGFCDVHLFCYFWRQRQPFIGVFQKRCSC